ncbi:MAG: hypothetical protein MdMp024_1079 [Bacteroidales bacterium]
MAMLPTSKQDNSTKEIISTKVFRINNDFLNQRKELINEAIAFESGTIARQKKTVVATLPNGKEAYFLKPGKETLRKIPNPYDMSPNVGSGNKSEDVKYHTVNGKADFTERKPRAGRVNTVLTIISTPLLIGKFIKNIIDSAKPNHIINVRLITDTIQQFVRTRGLCVLSGKQLLEELEPYLVRE